jgi:hypothetical protein
VGRKPLLDVGGQANVALIGVGDALQKIDVFHAMASNYGSLMSTEEDPLWITSSQDSLPSREGWFLANRRRASFAKFNRCLREKAVLANRRSPPSQNPIAAFGRKLILAKRRRSSFANRLRKLRLLRRTTFAKTKAPADTCVPTGALRRLVEVASIELKP